MPAWERLVVRALGSQETILTVVRREAVSATYLRVQVEDGGLLARHPPFPTMWLRLWFDDHGRSHQRAFTVVDPDPVAGRFWLEFALHPGVASDWARTCTAGDTVTASLLGSAPPWAPRRRSRRGTGPPDGPGAPMTLGVGLDADFPGRTIIVGDPASLPAVNAMLERLGRCRAEVWLEHRHAADRDLPVRGGAAHRIMWVRHRGEGAGIAEAVLAHWDEQPPGARDRVWIAAEAATTRRLASALRTHHGIPRDNVRAVAYWRNS